VTFSASGAQGKPVFGLKVDNSQVLYSGNAPGGGSSASTTWDTQFGTNGTHTLNLTVQDEAGRTATAVVSVNVSNPGGSTADAQKPNVAITNPANGAWTGNSLSVGAHAVDNVAVANIKFWANGSVFGTVTCGGPTCDGAVRWITEPLPTGAYEVNAVATDTAGNQFISTAITIYKGARSPFYPSGVSTSSPTLGTTFAKPAGGATLSGAAVVQLNATGVTAGSTLTYTLKIDGVVPTAQGPITASCNQPTCVVAWNWDTTAATSGLHTLSGTVTDTGGHTASTTISVAVSNTAGGGGGDTTAPTATITSPPNGAWTGNSIRVAASATDNGVLSTLKFYGNGTQFGQLTCGTSTCSGEQWWPTGSLPRGKHTITVVATDSAGNQTTSAPVVINK
jgi:large repetitive protein